jgi:hypothetical protein
MRKLRFSTVALWLSVGLGACSSQNSGPGGNTAGMQTTGAPMSGGGAGGVSAFAGQAAGGDTANAAGSMAADCGTDLDDFTVGIASAPVNTTPPMTLSEHARLMADGAPHEPVAVQNVTAGLRWQHDRLFLLLDPGFWEIPVQGPARWYPTATVLVSGVRAGDLDGDGDPDIMLLSTRMNDGPDRKTKPLVTRLAVWERTPDGLIERGEVLRGTNLVLPMPFVFGNVGGDANLDIVTFEDGAPVAYINDGSFAFTRIVLGDVVGDYASQGLLALDYSDRNADGKPDLMVVVGKDLENTAFVMLADGAGKFSPPGADVSKGKSPLVPYGPTGTGIGFADVTGDGISDIIMQDPQGTDSAPRINLYSSRSATSLAPVVQLEGLGFELADVDEDGQTDIVSTLGNRLIGMLARGNGVFESRDLGVSTSKPSVVDFVVDPGQGPSPAVIHVLYKLAPCPPCGAGCGGRCVLNACVTCLSDADCATGRCNGQACTP